MLRNLRLSGLAETLDVRLQEAAGHQLSHAEFLELILQDELLVRQERQIAHHTKAALFREVKPLDQFNWSFKPSIQKKQIFDLATGPWRAGGSSSATSPAPRRSSIGSSTTPRSSRLPARATVCETTPPTAVRRTTPQPPRATQNPPFRPPAPVRRQASRNGRNPRPPRTPVPMPALANRRSCHDNNPSCSNSARSWLVLIRPVIIQDNLRSASEEGRRTIQAGSLRRGFRRMEHIRLVLCHSLILG